MTQHFVGAQLEGRTVADTVVVAGAHEVEQRLLQAVRRRHITAQPVGRRRAVPREEDRLFAQPCPEPAEVRAVPRRLQRRQVVRDDVGALRFGQRHETVGDGAAEPIGVPRGQRCRDHRAGVEAIHRGAADAKGVHELDHCIGEVLHAGPHDTERGRRPEAGCVRRDAGEVRMPTRERRQHVA